MSRKTKSIPAITIGRKELDEIHKIAIAEITVPVLNRNYREIQQSLTIAALVKFLATYSIEVPFELDMKDE